VGVRVPQGKSLIVRGKWRAGSIIRICENGFFHTNAALPRRVSRRWRSNAIDHSLLYSAAKETPAASSRKEIPQGSLGH